MPWRGPPAAYTGFMRIFVVVVCLGLLLALTAYLASRLWLDLGDVEISTLGWIMIAGGAF